MNKREMICIRCPMGCRLSVTQDENGCTVTGNTCPRGREYGIQEMTCPTRVVTSSVRVENGRRPVCSVKTAAAVPKADIPAVLAAIRTISISAPIAIGDVICADVAGTGTALVATAND